MTYTLHHGDCLDILPTLPSGSIDAVIADPPYGTTACKWDSVIPLEAMWRELKRVIKPRGAVVLFASQPFMSVLVSSNLGWFKYEWVWQKDVSSNFLQASFQPIKRHECIAVFSNAPASYSTNEPMQYTPQTGAAKYHGKRTKHLPNSWVGRMKDDYPISTEYGDRSFPISLLNFNTDRPKVHPTQKPVELLRYLVRTYTNSGETVLDFTMGSGTTGVACAMEGRHFIGVELDAGYFDIAKRRIEQVQPALMEAAG